MKRLFLLVMLMMNVITIIAQKSVQYTYGYDATGNRINCAVIEFSDRNGLSDNIEKDFYIDDNGEMLIYPNPTKGILKFESKYGYAMEGCQLFDFNGRKLQDYNLKSTEGTIDLSIYSKGIYFLVVRVNLATYKYLDKVYKVPGKGFFTPKPFIAYDGDVYFPDYFDKFALKLLSLSNYKFGWMTLEQLDSIWQNLFNSIPLIK